MATCARVGGVPPASSSVPSGAAAGSGQGILSPVSPESILDLNSSTLRTSLICSLISDRPSAAPWAEDRLGIKSGGSLDQRRCGLACGVAPISPAGQPNVGEDRRQRSGLLFGC